MSKHIEQPSAPPPKPVQPRQSFWSIQTIVIMGAVMLAFLVFNATTASKSKTKIPKGMPDTLVTTNDQDLCKLVFIDLSGLLPTLQDY